MWRVKCGSLAIMSSRSQTTLGVLSQRHSVRRWYTLVANVLGP
jgi:hypothetical protein